MGAIRKIEASLPKVTYKGAAVGANSVVQAVSTAATQIAKPIEQAAAVSVAAVASVFTGLPITPQMVDQAATSIKTSTYAKPTQQIAPVQALAAKPLPAIKTNQTTAEKVSQAIADAPTWQKVAGVLALAFGAAYLLKRGKK